MSELKASNKNRAMLPSLDIKKQRGHLDEVRFSKGLLRLTLAFKLKTEAQIGMWDKIAPGLAYKAKAMAASEECTRSTDRPTVKIAPQKVELFPVVNGKGEPAPAFAWPAIQPAPVLDVRYSAKGEVIVRITLTKPKGPGDEPLGLCEGSDFAVSMVTAQMDIREAKAA